MRVLTIEKEKDSNRHQKQNIITLQENKQLKFRLLGKKRNKFSLFNRNALGFVFQKVV